MNELTIEQIQVWLAKMKKRADIKASRDHYVNYNKGRFAAYSDVLSFISMKVNGPNPPGGKAVICGTCGLECDLVTGKDVYPHREDLHELSIWRCDCGSYVGCHKGTSRPLGVPVDYDTRKARAKVHRKMDPLWKGKKMSRELVYRSLANKMGLRMSECHTGMFDSDQCKRALDAIDDILAEVYS